MKQSILKSTRSEWIKVKRRTKNLVNYDKSEVRPNLDRKEFERLRNAWKSTLANLEHHLVNDQF
jgi:hypothetical protein